MVQALLDRARSELGRKTFRYSMVSVVAVIVGQTVLVICSGVIGLSGVLSNLIAVTISAGPAYVLSRRWVWGQTGTHSVRDEIAPFWGMALLGLLLSTVTVGFADREWNNSFAVMLASIAAFGVVWVFKFLILEKLMWKQAVVETVELRPPA